LALTPAVRRGGPQWWPRLDGPRDRAESTPRGSARGDRWLDGRTRRRKRRVAAGVREL